MRESTCKYCGSKELKFKDEIYTCESCGTAYLSELEEGESYRHAGHFSIEGDVLVSYHGYDDEIVIPEGITRVIEQAFGYISAKSIKCPKSLKRFDGTLENCEKLEYFEAPSLTNISKEMFHKHPAIKKVVLQSVQEIPKEAFYQCKNLEEVVVPSAKVVRAMAFYQSPLANITAPKVQDIKNYAFQSCCLKSINFPIVQTIGDGAFADCETLEKATLPKVKSMGDGAFESCDNLKEIVAPNLEKLARESFQHCESLEKVCFPKLQTMCDSAFYGCEALKEVDCGLAVLEPNDRGQYDQFMYCPNLTTINLNESVNKKLLLRDDNTKKGGCYIATAVYGSYDCPQVWTLRRYRDDILAKTWGGRMFIHIYYAVSPTLVKWFGRTEWFQKLWRSKLDPFISKLQAKGVQSTAYEDKQW